MDKKGVFIVIDGTDGAGKKTQTDILCEKLKAYGFAVEIADFPQYGHKSAGLVEEYLNGRYGTAEAVGPHAASIFYACDRFDASFKIRKWLDEGKVVVSNRYVAANMGHQGGKIASQDARMDFFNWLYNLEYEVFGIPKPDLNIILHADPAVAQQKVDEKGVRDYVGGVKRDIHENDLNHLRQAVQVYREIANLFPDFSLIECTRNGQMLSREEIGGMIWRAAAPKVGYFADDGRTAFRVMPGHFYSDTPTVEDKPRQALRVQRIHPQAKLPVRPHASDAGLDIFSADYYTVMPGQRVLVSTGIKMAIPEGYSGLIWDKSGLAKHGLITIGGVIDSGYRGEILVGLMNVSPDIFHIAPGQKVAQMVIQEISQPEIQETIVDDQTSRNDGGFGSTGLF